MRKKQWPRPAVAARWEDRLARWHSSELSVAEFCRREQVHQVSFYNWRRKLEGVSKPKRRAPTRGAFVPIEIMPDAPAPTPESASLTCEVVLGPLVCRVPRGLDDESLRRLIRLLREEASRC